MWESSLDKCICQSKYAAQSVMWQPQSKLPALHFLWKPTHFSCEQMELRTFCIAWILTRLSVLTYVLRNHLFGLLAPSLLPWFEEINVLLLLLPWKRVKSWNAFWQGQAYHCASCFFTALIKPLERLMSKITQAPQTRRDVLALLLWVMQRSGDGGGGDQRWWIRQWWQPFG